jgi:glycosyltransferase involved in cell wall biosynthesis
LKIIFLVSTFPRYEADGSGRFVLSIADGIQKLGHEVHVLAPYHPKVEPFESRVKVHHFHYARRKHWHVMGYAQAMHSDQKLKIGAYILATFYFTAALFKLYQLEREHSFDLIHVHWAIPNGPVALPFASKYKLPIVVSLHGSDIFTALNNSFLGFLTRLVFRSAKAITACSTDLREGAIRLGADSDKTHLVPWGADPYIFKTQISDADLREKWSIPLEVPVILSLGRLVKKKGIHYLVEALPQILTVCPKTILLIAGSGPEDQNLMNLANELRIQESVRFLGDVPWQEVPELFSISDLFVVPSIHDERGNLDGLPTTILEAMAARCPVVATSVAGIPLVIQHEVTGLLVPEKDPFTLAHAVIRVIKDKNLAQRITSTAREMVVTNYNWMEVAKKFDSLYRV